MYARYNYNTSATAAQILADVVLILTGTTSLASLSVGCDQVNSFILTGYNLAGWTLHDQVSATKVILKAPSIDLPGVYIYQELNTATTANQITTNLYEGWNAATHVGTNLTNSSALTTIGARFTVGTAASIVLAASANYSMLQSNTAAGIGGGAGFTCIAQHTRLSPWDTVANAYPNSVYFSARIASGAVGVPRVKNPAGGDLLTGAASPSLLQNGMVNGKIIDGLGGAYAPLIEIGILSTSDRYLGGSISAVCDIWIGLTYPNNFDEMTANGKTYVFLQQNVAGSGNLCVPRG
jgi:hypothetical protein